MYGETSKSIPQKAIIILLETIILLLSWLLLFRNGLEKIGLHTEAGNMVRRQILFAFNVIVFLRMWITVVYLVRRKIPMEETFSIPLAFALYYLGFAWLGYKTVLPPDLFDLAGILIFLFGSTLNTLSELMRQRWKNNPDNKGKIYTKGLFGWSMHINYFGDLLWVSGYAIVTRNWYSVLIILFLFSFFTFFNIPKLDKYLKEKYGEQFEIYQKKTKKFIPFVY